MGKAARLRRHRGITPPERSAYARIWEECRIVQDDPASVGVAAWNARETQNVLSVSRVIRYRDWGIPDIALDDLAEHLGEMRFPFPHALLDAGDIPIVGDYRLVAVTAVEADDLLTGWCVRRDSWIKATIFLDKVRNGERYVGMTLPSRGDPAVDANIPADIPVEAPSLIGVAAITMLAMLECANVEMLPALDPPQKGHVAHGIPHYDVVIRQRTTRREPPDEHRKVDWSHRWEVAAHFMHFKRGPIFNAAPPEKRIIHPEHGECVRIWCPSFIKGPADKPLIPKIRTVVRS